MAEANQNEQLIVDKRFNIFDKSANDSSVISSNISDYFPLTQVSSNSQVFEFLISGDGEQYLNLNDIQLKVTGSVINTDASAADAKDLIICNSLHSLFSQIDVSFNDRSLTEASNNYPYIAYIRSLIETTGGEKKGRLRSQLFYLDNSDKIASNLTTENAGLAKRFEYTKQGAKIELISRLYIDAFSCKNFLLPGVNIRLKLYKQRPQFFIITSHDDSKATFVIDSAVLLVPRLTINPQLVLSHLEIIKKQPAIYPFYKYTTRVHTLPSGSRNIILENLFSDKIPSLVIVVLIASKDFSGDYKTNPFNFRNYKLRNMALIMNGQSVPGNSINPDFSKKTTTNAALFKNFTDSIEKQFGIIDTGLRMADLASGYTMFIFDISESSSGTRTGELRLRAEFTKQVTEAVNILVIGRFKTRLLINESRVVSYDNF